MPLLGQPISTLPLVLLCHRSLNGRSWRETRWDAKGNSTSSLVPRGKREMKERYMSSNFLFQKTSIPGAFSAQDPFGTHLGIKSGAVVISTCFHDEDVVCSSVSSVSPVSFIDSLVKPATATVPAWKTVCSEQAPKPLHNHHSDAANLYLNFSAFRRCRKRGTRLHRAKTEPFPIHHQAQRGHKSPLDLRHRTGQLIRSDIAELG
jgi:hypothetical protein